VAGWWIAAGQYTSVPALAGRTGTVAREVLGDAGLKARDGTGKHSNTVPRGVVISTSPAAGDKVDHGGTVTLITSLGPTFVTVPSVTGQPVSAAVRALQAAGLKVAAPTYEGSPTITSGLVIASTPAAYARWPQNKPVQLVVSFGPPLPDFVGQQIAVALAAASVGGYNIQPNTLAASSQPAGTIVKQSPPAGGRITAGMVVQLYVSPGPAMVSVPNIDGLPRQQAVQELTQAGFQVTVSSSGFGNRVTSYSPTGSAPQGSTITINIGFTF